MPINKAIHDYPNFYNNPLIKLISKKPKWSFSNPESKKPINVSDLKMLLNSRDTRINVHGADFHKPDNMTTLDDLIDSVPNLPNHAYYLDCKTDGFIVLDIEKTCPKKLKDAFLKLPYLYGEYSLSGKGIHLIAPLPKNFKDFPDYMDQPKLQEKNHYYEILLTHWVTFTRNTLPKPMSKGEAGYTYEDIYKHLVSENHTAHNVNLDDFMDKKPKIKNEDAILSLMDEFKYSKTVEDFPQVGRLGDYSKYEFGMAAFLYWHMKYLIKNTPIFDVKDYNDNSYAWMVYELLQKRLEHRSKHDTFREGMPFLLFIAASAIAKSQTKYDKKSNSKKKS